MDNRRILIADDNPSVHEDFRKVLCSEKSRDLQELDAMEKGLFVDANSATSTPQAQGYTVDSAYQGIEALQLVRTAAQENRPYALIFMDVRMPPGMDGIETIARIWQEFPFIEMVICTAYSDYSWDEIIERLGSSDKLLFLKKPFTTIAVKQMAQSLVAKWNLGEESRRYTQKLEQEVQERTRQLQRMLDDLHQKNETLLEVQADLRDTEEKFNVLTKSSNDGIVLMDEGGKVSFWNPAARVMFGYASEEAVGKEIHTLIVPEAYRDRFREELKGFQQTGPEGVIGKTLELYAVQKSGSEIPVEISVSALQVKKAWHTAAIIRDISERKKMEQDMTVMAHYDMLTGLPNRSLFFDRFTQFLSLAHRHNHVMAVLYLDLDKFKQINDNYGHDVGDTVLQETAKRLGSGLRKSDTVTRLNARGIDFLNLRESDTVARIGGDEFMILLSQIRERSDSILVAKRTIAVLSRPIHIDDEVFTLGVSVGISLFPDHGTTMDALIKNADIAMYRAKALSGNRYEMFDGRKDTAPAKKPKDGTTNQ